MGFAHQTWPQRAFRLGVLGLAGGGLFGAAGFLTETFRLTCARPASLHHCELRVASWGRTEVTPLPDGALEGASVETSDRIDKDGGVTTFHHIALATRQGRIVSRNQDDAAAAVRAIEAFLRDPGRRDLAVESSNRLTLFLAAGLVTAMLAYVLFIV